MATRLAGWQDEKGEKKWFWEQCGLQQLPATDGELHWFDRNENIVSPVDSETSLPIIDLNNLFEYAVPELVRRFMTKLNKKLEITWTTTNENTLCQIFLDEQEIAGAANQGSEPMNLWWAIYKALGGKQTFA